MTRRLITIAALCLAAPSAMAQSDELPQFDDELPVPTLNFERLPPDYSWDFGAHFSFGDITYWRNLVAPWIGFGARGSWGKNFGQYHRVGALMTLSHEGEFGILSSTYVEPHASWDVVSGNGIMFGLSAGPAFGYHYQRSSSGGNQDSHETGLGASAAARIGWSQTWTRVGRRVFIYVEPKARMVDGAFGPVAQLVVGSGKGY